MIFPMTPVTGILHPDVPSSWRNKEIRRTNKITGLMLAALLVVRQG